MRTLLTFYFIILSFVLLGQSQLNFTTPIDTGQGTNRVVVFPNVAVWNGQTLDMVVCVKGYYSSEVSDTNWYDDVQFRAVTGDFNIKIPYLDTFTRCVDLEYKLVETGTLNCVNVDISNTIFDLDSSNLRQEFIYAYDYDNSSLNFPTSITPLPDSAGSYFFAGDEVNKNNMEGAVHLNYLNECSFEISYCNTAYNNGGNSGYFMSSSIDDPTILALGDAIFLYFNGESYGDINQLRWAMASNSNIDSIVVQHSLDGVVFIPLENVGSLEAGRIAYDYHYSFITPHATNYYRLYVYYTDGDIEFSNVIVVHNEVSNEEIKIYPNPYYAGVNIVSAYEIHRVTIYNSKGSVLSSENVGYAGHIHYNLYEIENRCVFIKVHYGDGQVKILKLVKYL